jgi:hypothetical protein
MVSPGTGMLWPAQGVRWGLLLSALVIVSAGGSGKAIGSGNSAYDKQFYFEHLFADGPLGIKLTGGKTVGHLMHVKQVTSGNKELLSNVHAGDVLVGINGNDVSDMTAKQCAKRIKDAGYPLTLRFRKLGQGRPSVAWADKTMVSPDAGAPAGNKAPLGLNWALNPQVTILPTVYVTPPT